MLWATLLGSALPLIIGVAIVLFFVSRENKPQQQSPDMTAWQLQQRNQEWISFIEAYDKVAETPAEKQLVRHMLFDAAAQGLGYSEIAGQYIQPGQEVGQSQEQVPAYTYTEYAPQQMPTPVYAQPPAASQQLDNSSLLLYFGAFLFVASVGLFIAFGGASASVRTVAVLLVMAIMYVGGQWMFRTKPKLQSAGLAFAAIGIVIAPLAGLAFYNYIFTREHGALIWLLTSLFCMALYVHALVTLKKPLISYLLIFTFLSLFESGISVAVAPVYYFGWGLAFVGIILQLLSRWRGYYPELKESSRYSSYVFLPIALLTALAMAPVQGSGQLGVSLLLATAFYALEAWGTKGVEQETNAIVSQAAGIVAVGCLVYASTHRWLLVVVGVLAVNVLQALVMMAVKAESRLWRNFGSVLLSAGVADILLAIGKPESLLAAAAALVGVALIVWWRQKRADAYGAGALAFMALPYFYGQITATPSLDAGRQTVLGLIALLVLLVVYIWQMQRGRRVQNWTVFAAFSYVLGAASVAVASTMASPLLCLIIAIAIAATMVLLAEQDKKHDWAEAAGIFLVVPIVRGWNDQAVFLAGLLIALAVFITMALRYRSEFLRWGSTVLWLILPLGFGRGALGSSWHPAYYAWAYVAVVIALIASRAIARGVILFSGKTPLAAYTRSASLSYVVGYVAAAVLAVAISLASHNSRIHTTIILLVLMGLTYMVSLDIEKRRDTLALLPILAQAALLSGIRPHQDGARLTVFLLCSSALALACYAVSKPAKRAESKRQKGSNEASTQVSLITAFFAPAFTMFFATSVWPMPLGLLIAGALLCYHLRTSQQVYRELAGAVITISLLWFLGTFHVHPLQAYVHVIIANLALYAYWRARRNEKSAEDGYLWAMLATATVPLALQALGGLAGGLYGWWLLLEQIVFMLLGMALGKRFVTFWGMYVALAAVLFQLRHLGWAALTVLALFLIGLAVYQLQKHSDQS